MKEVLFLLLKSLPSTITYNILRVGSQGNISSKDTTEGHKHYYIQSNDKNLDKICELWLNNDLDRNCIEIME